MHSLWDQQLHCTSTTSQQQLCTTSSVPWRCWGALMQPVCWTRLCSVGTPAQRWRIPSQVKRRTGLVCLISGEIEKNNIFYNVMMTVQAAWKRLTWSDMCRNPSVCQLFHPTSHAKDDKSITIVSLYIFTAFIYAVDCNKKCTVLRKHNCPWRDCVECHQCSTGITDWIPPLRKDRPATLQRVYTTV